MHACCHFSCVQLFVTPRTVTYQAPLPMGFSKQEYWSGLPCPPPGDLDPQIEPSSLCLLHKQVGSLPLPPGKGNGNPLQHACLENPMGRGAW